MGYFFSLFLMMRFMGWTAPDKTALPINEQFESRYFRPNRQYCAPLLRPDDRREPTGLSAAGPDPSCSVLVWLRQQTVPAVLDLSSYSAYLGVAFAVHRPESPAGEPYLSFPPQFYHVTHGPVMVVHQYANQSGPGVGQKSGSGSV